MKHGIFLKLAPHCLLALLLLAGCGQSPRQTAPAAEPAATSAADLAAEPGAELKTVSIGDVTVTWLQDTESKHSRSTFPDADDRLIDSLQLQDGIPATISAFLVQTGGETILFDAGMGNARSRLLPLLDSLGIRPESIGYLYITHLHGDHVGGMFSEEGAVFPQAEIYLARPEYEGWMNLPDGRNAQAVKLAEVYKDRLHLFEFGDTLPGNVRAIDAVGHTPGHTAYQAGRLLIIGDLIHGAALQFDRPDLCARFDMDKEAAVRARRQLLQYARENGLIIAGMHLPAPAIMIP